MAFQSDSNFGRKGPGFKETRVIKIKIVLKERSEIKLIKAVNIIFASYHLYAVCLSIGQFQCRV